MKLIQKYQNPSGPINWHKLYSGIKYNTDLNSIEKDPLYSVNEIGEVQYPSFEEWSNGNKWNDIAPAWMSKDYNTPMTYGQLYENMSSAYMLHNTQARILDRRNRPEKYIGDLHNYINRERHRQGLSSLGDNGAALILDSGIRGLVNVAGTAMQAPLELSKTFMAPGTYIPYYGAIDRRIQPVYDNIDTAVGGVFSAINPLSYIDWGSAGMEGSHVKLPWNPNSNGVETPAIIDAAGFIAMPYVAKGLGKAGKYVKNKYTDWFDPYTSFNANFGYYGNPMQRFWGTIARRFNLPDKARLPEVLRKQDGDVRPVWSGRKPGHVNMTIDRGVVPHSNGSWLERDLYITDPTTVFNEEIIPSLKSIEPSDVFVDGMPKDGITLDPSKTTIVSGDIESLKLAKQQGMSTLSSKRARELYEKAKELDAAAKAAEKERNPTSKISFEKPKYKDVVNFTNNYWIEYAKELQRLQSRRGTPTLKDIKALEDMTGLEAHVKPIEEFSIFKDNVLKWFSNPSKYERPIYPNGNPVSTKMWILRGILDGSDFPYNKIFYDRASPIEFNTPDAWLGKKN